MLFGLLGTFHGPTDTAMYIPFLIIRLIISEEYRTIQCKIDPYMQLACSPTYNMSKHSDMISSILFLNKNISIQVVVFWVMIPCRIPTFWRAILHPFSGYSEWDWQRGHGNRQVV